MQTSGESVMDLNIKFGHRLSFHLDIERITCKTLKIP